MVVHMSVIEYGRDPEELLFLFFGGVNSDRSFYFEAINSDF